MSKAERRPRAGNRAPAQAGGGARSAPADEKRQAEARQVAAKKAEEERKKAEKIEKERAKKQAEVDRKAAEGEPRKKDEEQRSARRRCTDAAARLKQAQAAYQAEVAKSNKGGAVMIRLRRLRDDQSGMSYVFIGMGMMAFLSASMLAIDVGMLMTSRSQAQNSADAGALAGATALVLRRLRRPHADGPGRDARDQRPRR